MNGAPAERSAHSAPVKTFNTSRCTAGWDNAGSFTYWRVPYRCSRPGRALSSGESRAPRPWHGAGCTVRAGAVRGGAGRRTAACGLCCAVRCRARLEAPRPTPSAPGHARAGLRRVISDRLDEPRHQPGTPARHQPTKNQYESLYDSAQRSAGVKSRKKSGCPNLLLYNAECEGGAGRGGRVFKVHVRVPRTRRT